MIGCLCRRPERIDRMRTSVVIAGANAPANAFVVWRGYEESIAKARAYDYDGVELALGAASDIDMQDVDHVLDQYGIQVSCISTGLTYAQRGLYMTSTDAEIRAGAINAISSLIRLAEHHGGLVTLGRVRGYVAPGQDRREAELLLYEELLIEDFLQIVASQNSFFIIFWITIPVIRSSKNSSLISKIDNSANAK